MITYATTVYVDGIDAQSIYDFMLHCSDEQYAAWWPGTHLAFHTIQSVEGDVGNLVYFDELVGHRRLKYRAVVTVANPNTEIVWQMKKGILIPAWLGIKLTNTTDGVEIAHTMRAGYVGRIGRLLDSLLRLYLNERYAQDLAAHADTEFRRLAVLLGSRT